MANYTIKDVDLIVNINGESKSLELDSSTSISINMQFSDYSNPTATKIPYSNSISLPRTKINSQIFDHIYRVDHSILNFNSNIRTDYTLYVGGNVLNTGYMKLETITKTSYNIRLYGDLGDYFYKLQETKLSELDKLMPDVTHTISAAELARIWTPNTINNMSYYYAMSYQGQYDKFDSDKVVTTKNLVEDVTWAQSNGKEYANPTLNENKRGNINFYGEYRSQYQRPMLRLKDLFTASAKSVISWETDLSDPFFNDSNPYWNDVWVICPNLNVTPAGGAASVNIPLITNTYSSKPNLPLQYNATNTGKYSRDQWVPDGRKYWSQVTGNGTTIANYSYYQNFYGWDGGSDVRDSATPDVLYAPGNAAIITGIPPTDYIVMAENTTDTAIEAIKGGYVNMSVKLNMLTSSMRYRSNSNGNKTITKKGNLTIRFKCYYKAVSAPASAWKEASNGNSETIIQLNDSMTGGGPIARRMTWEWDDYDGSTTNFAAPFKYQNQEVDFRSGDEYDRTKGSEWDVNMRFAIEGSPEPLLIQIRMYGDGGYTHWWDTASKRVQYYGVGFKYVGDNNRIFFNETGVDGTTSGSTIDYTDIIRTDHTCYDFVMSYAKIFGLLFIKDKINKRVSIVTRNSYFSKLESKDFTYKIDRSKQFDISPTNFSYRYGVFKYNNKGTKYEEEYLNKTGREYGSLRFDNGNEFTDVEYNYIDNIIFDNCIVARGYSQYFNGRSAENYRDNKNLPHFQDNSESKVDVNFVLCFVDGIQTLPSGNFIITDTDDLMHVYGECWNDKGISHNRYPKITRVIERGGNSYSLNFGAPSISYNDIEPAHSLDTAGDESIYARFWRTYLNDVFRNEAKELTCYVLLNSSDIQDDLFNKFIYINDSTWIITKVHSYNPLKDSPTKVTFAKVQNTSSYIGQKYIDGQLTLSYNGNPIYDSDTDTSATIRVNSDISTIQLVVNSTLAWQLLIDNGVGITASPMSGNAGTTTIRLTLPENNTGSAIISPIRIQWGGNTTLINIIQVSNWTVTPSANMSDATAYANGYAEPIQVTDGSIVSFTTEAPTGYTFGYWIIDDAIYTDKTVSLQVNDNVNAVAYWFGSDNSVKIICNDNSTYIEGVTKTGEFWILNKNQSYTFRNSQSNLSGYKFDADEDVINPANSFQYTVTQDDTLNVYYDTLLVNLDVINNSSVAFNANNILIQSPSGTVLPNPVGSVGSGNEVNILYSYPTTNEGSYTIMSDNVAGILIDISPNTINYSLGQNIPTVIITIEDALIPELSITPETNEVNYSTNQYTIDVTANTTWQLTIPSQYANYISATPTSGEGNSTVNVTIQSNDTTDNRTGEIIFNTTYGTNDVASTHTVTQRQRYGTLELTINCNNTITLDDDIIGSIINSSNQVVDQFTLSTINSGETLYTFTLEEDNYTVSLSSYSGTAGSLPWVVNPTGDIQANIIGGSVSERLFNIEVD